MKIVTSRIPSRLLCPLLIAFTTLPLMAQRKIEYRLTSFGVDSVPKMEFTNTPGAATVIEAVKGYVTLPIKAELRDDTYLDFFTPGKMPAEGETLPPLFSAKIPDGTTSDILLVLLHEEKKVTPMVLDFKKMDLKPGGQYVINLLPTALQIGFTDDEKLVGKPSQIKAGMRLNLGEPPTEKSLRLLNYFDPTTKKWVNFSSSLCIRDDKARELLFCYAKKGASRPIVTAINIYDVPPAQKEEKP